MNESLELILEVIENRIERRMYDYYLNTLIFSLFSNDKPQSYSQFKKNFIKNQENKKMTKEEKKALKEKNNKILRSIKGR